MNALTPSQASGLPVNRHVRSGTAQDIPATHPVLNGPRPLYPDFDDWWAKVRAENRACFRLEDQEGALRGIAVIAPRSDRIVKLCTFCLVEGERGTGRGFLDAVCAELARQGFAEVYGSILPDQHDIRAFFAKAGFRFPTAERLERDLTTLDIDKEPRR